MKRMDKRSHIIIVRNNKPIAAIAYSGNTNLNLWTKLYQLYYYVLKNEKRMTDRELRLKIVRFAENCTPSGFNDTQEINDLQDDAEFVMNITETENPCVHFSSGHGGLFEKEYVAFKKMYSYEHLVLENIMPYCGIAIITHNEIEKIMYDGSDEILIDLDAGQVQNGTVTFLDDLDPKRFSDKMKNQLANMDLSEFEVQAIPEIYKKIREMESNDNHYVICNGKVLEV